MAVFFRWFALSTTPVAVAFALLVVAGLPQPVMLVTAGVRAETLEIVVHNPDAARFGLPLARLDAHAACLHDLTIEPGPASAVHYTRTVGGPLVVAVYGRSVWRAREKPVARTGRDGVVTFSVNPAGGMCAAPRLLRLPIAGEMRIGVIARAISNEQPPMPVLSGELKLYGRVVDALWGGRAPLNWLARITGAEPGALYPAETMVLPPGAQLGRAFVSSARTNDTVARWSGFADADMTSAGGSERGLWIEASTNATTLDVLPSAPGSPMADKPEKVSLTLAARLVGDPNLRWFVGLVSFVIVLVGVQAQVAAIPAPTKPS